MAATRPKARPPHSVVRRVLHFAPRGTSPPSPPHLAPPLHPLLRRAGECGKARHLPPHLDACHASSTLALPPRLPSRPLPLTPTRNSYVNLGHPSTARTPGRVVGPPRPARAALVNLFASSTASPHPRDCSSTTPTASSPTHLDASRRAPPWRSRRIATHGEGGGERVSGRSLLLPPAACPRCSGPDQLFEEQTAAGVRGDSPLSAVWARGREAAGCGELDIEVGAVHDYTEEEEIRQERCGSARLTDEVIEVAPRRVDAGTSRLVGRGSRSAETCTGSVCHREGEEGRARGWGEWGVVELGALKKPYVGEPHLVLAQVCLGMGRFEEGEVEAKEGLRHMLQLRCVWDKRVDQGGVGGLGEGVVDEGQGEGLAQDRVGDS
ncbi:uncharacterized protein A4U43_C07F22310 [Asparagus officinalis]|uniref:Uncharacterized protein n=1 Tax=Asparagus officinalis TaxID=4686 RepID=A0A5P1EE38_ASPOF|nr:uncharacterized protein A4U43_C07F22310 [Asparagus officinalis]